MSSCVELCCEHSLNHDKGKDHLPQHAGNTPPNAQDLDGHLCHKGVLLAHILFVDHQDPS